MNSEEMGAGDRPEPGLSIEEIRKDITAEFDKKYKSEIAGLNRKVSEITSERDLLKAQLGLEVDLEKTTIGQVKAIGEKLKFRESMVEQKERLLEKIVKHDISPELGFKMVGLTNAETDHNIDLLLEELERAAKNSRTNLIGENIKRPESGQAEHRLTLAEFKRMSAAEQARIPSSVRLGLLGGNS